MSGRLWRGITGGLLVAIWVGLVVGVGAGTGTLQEIGGRIRIGEGNPAGALGETANGAAANTWRAARLPLLCLFVATTSSIASRSVNRRRRLARMRRFEIRLGREDLASPFKREKLFDAWHGQLSARWWQRLIRGQPSLALELHHGDDGTERFVVAVADGDERMLEGRLTETYPDVRLVPLAGMPRWTGKLVRLKKRRPFIERLQTLKDDEQSLSESLVSTLGALREQATVQLVLTPAPRSCHRLSRWLLKHKERELTHTERRIRDDIGVDSVVEDKELKGALETQHRSLYFTEIRITSNANRAVQAVVGAFSEMRSENTLGPRQIRLRRPLYANRVRFAAPNPLPGWWKGVFSSSELAALWALPRQRAKSAPLVRSPVRRAPAPPEVCRERSLALMHDEQGSVGLWPEDRKYGLALIGGQGTGKTSAMARTIAIDADDRDAALVVLDPKHDLAHHALSLVPPDRTCWYMDLARPEVGIDPLGVQAEPGVVADMLVAALREAHAEGAILAASDRFLRHAAMAVCAVEERPTLWHMLELLSPRREEYRERVTDRLARQPQHAALLRYWGTSFPELWQDATRGQLGMALDAPRNKLERLITTVEVDKALRHPFPLDLRKVIQNREVLIVNGSLGEVGQDNAVTVMQLLLQLLHQALKQQQLLAPDQRPRVALKVDEAHLVLTPSFAELLALHRAAGLEVVAAWQYNAQLADGVIRSGLRSLLRSVSMFAMGEVRDARDQAEIAMEVYTDSIKTEREDQERLRLSPDDVVRLPVHTAVNSWVAHGARRSAFVARTYGMEARDPARLEHHLERQRAAGGGWPTSLPPPAEVAPLPAVADPPGSLDRDDVPTEEPKPAPPSPAGRRRRPQGPNVGPRRERATISETEDAPSYRAVHRDDLTGLVVDRSEPDSALASSLDPAARDLEIVRALWRYGFLLTSQIAAEWWPENHPSGAQRRLTKLARAGWLRRARPTVVAGNHEWVYSLARDGFKLGQRHTGSQGPYIPPSARFAERIPSDHHGLLHDLQLNAWVLAYKRIAGPLLADWMGPDECALEVPLKQARPRSQQIGVHDVGLPGHVQIRGLARRGFGRVAPDAALSMELTSGRRFELLIELDRTRRPNRNDSKLVRYDALITAWWRKVDRYREPDEPPVVVFVCQDEQDITGFMRLAERQVRGCLANPGDSPERFRYSGRERMLFVAERDVHTGDPRAFMLARQPAATVPRGVADVRVVQLPKAEAVSAEPPAANDSRGSEVTARRAPAARVRTADR